ncbi:DUF4240 domain-containing protein [Pontibacter sp. G13]|uniref:DUF4240 domain-containing protein n=1 Tax=Pontibacter sp. G13 TaxID=3074898 RepID=UPI00288A7347|nr:DUF4240 domain-containing protein [Pontibacter sp. G13]WNJ21466.1 DUF4240 domain-containing protein [Pontibacter sp. G13]
MTEKQFWKIIKKSHGMFTKQPEKHQLRLIRLLTKLPAKDIIAFDGHFSRFMDMANHWDLRGAAAIIYGNDSQEFFSDFRGWLITRGKKPYYRVLRQPEYVRKLVKPYHSLDWVGFDAVSLEAYEQKTGKPLPAPNLIKGRVWKEADLPQLYPNLWKAFVEKR